MHLLQVLSRNEEFSIILVIIGFGLFAGLILLLVSRRGNAVRDLLREVATAAGWTDLRNLVLASSGVKGMWRQFPVELGYRPRQKGVPSRLTLRVRARADARLNIKRRFEGFLSNRPLTWFGPPIVELHQPAASMMWVRGDRALAERVFADAQVASLLSANLVARFDEVNVDGKGLRIVRALDEKPVRQKYGMPAFSMSFDAGQYAPIAREEIALAEAIAQKLSMMA